MLTRSSTAVTDKLKARALAEKLKIDSLRSVDPSLLETDELVSLFDSFLESDSTNKDAAGAKSSIGDEEEDDEENEDDENEII